MQAKADLERHPRYLSSAVRTCVWLRAGGRAGALSGRAWHFARRTPRRCSKSAAGSRHGYDVSNPAAVREALGGDGGLAPLRGRAASASALGWSQTSSPTIWPSKATAGGTTCSNTGSDSRYFHLLRPRLGGEPTTPVRACAVHPGARPSRTARSSSRAAFSWCEEDGRLRVAYGHASLSPFRESVASLDGGSSAAIGRRSRISAGHQSTIAHGCTSLLEQQHYRLAWWRLARDESPYRRFFDVNGLVGVRVDPEDVFEAVHRLVLEWCRDGSVHGLRVDHVDGLADPAQYLESCAP